MRTAKYSKCGTAEFVVLDKTATVAVRTAGAVARAVRVNAGICRWSRYRRNEIYIQMQ